jgi:hypothetical protein
MEKNTGCTREGDKDKKGVMGRKKRRLFPHILTGLALFMVVYFGNKNV